MRDLTNRQRGMAALTVAWSIALVTAACAGRWDVTAAMLFSLGLGGALGQAPAP
jgi:type II secretory pathway component PulK